MCFNPIMPRVGSEQNCLNTLVGKSLLAETCENNTRADADEVGEGWLTTSATLTLAGKFLLADLASVLFCKWLIQKGYLPE